MRGCHTPLSLSVGPRYSEDDYDDDDDVPETRIAVATDILDALARYSQRWQTIDFGVPKRCYKIFEAIQDHLPLLVSISLTNPPAPSFLTFSHAPLFRTICVVGPSVDFPFFSFFTLNSRFIGLTHVCLELLGDHNGKIPLLHMPT